VKGKILLLDNDAGVLEGFRALFEHTGIEVYTTSSLLDFHSLIAQHDPDLILVDVNMATLKGNEVVSAARNRLTSSMVVLFSGISPIELKELSHAAGADGFLSKMEEPDAILKQVMSWVEQRRRLRGHA
jgi:DNA-binding NarL/FixJ family response regulator